MKNFDDYCNYLSQKIKDEPERFPIMQKSYVIDKLTPENIQAFMQNYSEEVLTMASQMAMCYLQTYHEWLSEQLS